MILSFGLAKLNASLNLKESSYGITSKVLRKCKQQKIIGKKYKEKTVNNKIHFSNSTIINKYRQSCEII